MTASSSESEAPEVSSLLKLQSTIRYDSFTINYTGNMATQLPTVDFARDYSHAELLVLATAHYFAGLNQYNQALAKAENSHSDNSNSCSTSKVKKPVILQIVKLYGVPDG
jgi:hypothetical protein